MKSAVFDIVREMNRGSVEFQMVLQCAPVLAGVKLSNLLIVEADALYRVFNLLEESPIHCFLLKKDEAKAVLFLYYPKKLQEYLLQEDIRHFMRKFGYEDCAHWRVLSEFQRRYLDYMEHRQKFPHEMGILLGYPVEDVAGFQENQGRDFLYTGYWKVYGHLAQKIVLFRLYEQVREQQIQMFAAGLRVRELMRLYEMLPPYGI